jgi:HD domain
VAWLLRCNDRPDEVVAAGLLHDLVEKTSTTSAELHRLFGARIAQFVETVSDDQSIGDCEDRKRDLRARVAHADTDTAAIFAADKIAKVRELALLAPWQLHETNIRAKLAHYRASLEMLRRVAGTVALVDLLDAELKRLIAPGVTGLTAPERSLTPHAEPQQASSSDNLKPAGGNDAEYAAEPIEQE